jgi:hypothetical protein
MKNATTTETARGTPAAILSVAPARVWTPGILRLPRAAEPLKIVGSPTHAAFQGSITAIPQC